MLENYIFKWLQITCVTIKRFQKWFTFSCLMCSSVAKVSILNTLSRPRRMSARSLTFLMIFFKRFKSEVCSENKISNETIGAEKGIRFSLKSRNL